MREKEKHIKFGSYGLLAVGFFDMLSIQLFKVGAVYALSTIIWVTLFYYFILTTDAKKERQIGSLILSLGFALRYLGITGIWVVDIPLLGIFGFLFYDVMLFSRKCFKYLPGFFKTLVLPSFWMVLYGITALIRLPAISRLDLFFFDFKPLIQLEHYIGAAGLTYLLVWLCSCLTYVMIRKSLPVLTGVAVVFVVILTMGSVSLSRAPQPEFTVRTAYTTGPYVGDFLDYVALPYEELVESMQRSVEEAAKQGAEILVFNEEAFELPDTEAEQFLEAVCDAAKGNAIHVLVGLDIPDTDDSEDGKSFNRIVWVDKQGTILDSYDKYQLIPVMESGYVRGAGKIPSLTIEAGGHDVNVAFAICYDSNFPAYMRRIPKETDLMFLPSWDWKGITDLHYRLCATIALENEVTLLKPTYDGISAALDPHGRVLQLTSTNASGYETVHIVELPVERRN